MILHAPPGIKVFAPATVGNIACGFDVMGLALDAPGDEVVVRTAPGSGIVSLTVTGDDNRLSSDPTRDCAALAGAAVLTRLGPRAAHVTGIAMEVHKGLPLSAGMGGSAASAVGGAVAVNALMGGALSDEELLACAMEGEAGGSGASHSDNVAPCLLGGIVLVPPGEPLRMVPLPVPSGLTAAVVHPHIEIETAAARQLLGDTISLEAGTVQWGNTAGLVAGFFNVDWGLISRCLVDVVAEPVRAPLVPGFSAVKRAALAAGAVGVSLSGSGPSMFALCDERAVAEAVGSAMVDAFRNVGGVAADLTVSAVGGRGARVIEDNTQ
jgi:homoserine kinase